MNLWIRRAARIFRLYVIILSVFSTQIYPLTILNAAPMLQGGVPTYCTDMNALETRLNQGGTVLFNACPNGVVIFTRRIIVNAPGIDLTIDGGGGGVDSAALARQGLSPDALAACLRLENDRSRGLLRVLEGRW
jgi:hypothetical protein